MKPRSDHLRSIDALRGGAMLLGVLLHALIPYLSDPVPHLLWPVREPAPGVGIDGLYWWIHGFRVPLFFVIAGMFAARSLDRRGEADFLARRFWRLGVPLIAGTMTVVMLMYLVWSWGWVKSGLAEPRHIGHFRFGHNMQKDLYGFAHLWFLEYLLIYSVLLCVSRRAVGMLRGFGRARWASLLLIPTAVTLLIDPRPMTEFHNWFLPRAAEFVFHGWFFAAGVMFAAGVPAVLVRLWWVGLLLSALSFVGFLAFLPMASAAEWAQRVPFAASASLFAWLSIWGWIGLFVRISPGRSGIVRLGAAAAYWVYVTHPPAVGLVQVLLYRVPVSAWSKAVASFVFATAFCLVTYRYVWKPLADRLLGEARAERRSPLPAG